MVAVRVNLVAFLLFVLVRVMERTAENSVALVVLLNRRYAPKTVPLLGPNLGEILDRLSATIPVPLTEQNRLKTKQNLVSSMGASRTENISTSIGFKTVTLTGTRTGPIVLNPLQN